MTTERLRVTKQRGGDHHPIPTKAFIIQYLYLNTDATISEVHRAYKERLREIESVNRPRYPYRRAAYSSFKRQFLALVGKGLIEYTGRDEESQEARFEYWPEKLRMRVYRLTAQGLSGDLFIQEDGLTRKLASDLTDGQGTDKEKLRELPEIKVFTDGRQPVKRRTNRKKS